MDQKIREYIRDNPGTNLQQTAGALLEFYTSTYTKDWIRILAARGEIRAEVDQAAKGLRYHLYLNEPRPQKTGGWRSPAGPARDTHAQIEDVYLLVPR